MSTQDLTNSVDRLTGEAIDVRAQLRSRTRALWVVVGVGGVLLGLLVWVTLNNSQAIARNNAKLCPFIGILIPQPGDAQPSTPRGVQIGEDAKRVSRDFGCQ